MSPARANSKSIKSVKKDPLLAPALNWFAGRDYRPFDYQIEAWRASLSGQSGLITAATGTGKSYAAWFGTILSYLANPADYVIHSGQQKGKKNAEPDQVALTTIWLTPLRALAGDLCENILEPVVDLQLPFSVEVRTGDTSAAKKARQKERLPTCLITTPESLSILLSYPGNEEKFATLKHVIVDEWHELIGSKRGSMVELLLARLKKIVGAGKLQVWGLTATLANLDTALDALTGDGEGVLIRGSTGKELESYSVLPESLSNLPWTGHTGLPMVEDVAALVRQANTSLVFTNTRSQTEQWYQELIECEPELVGRAALHHGSLDYDVRRFVEHSLKNGRLNCVVSTSSLDLGVDFAPVDRVVQVGSPKGVARAMQRAGRSGHRPGQVSSLYMVPCHALELVELCAARIAIGARQVEKRFPLNLPLDLLCQHVVTIALGSGFKSEDLYNEVRTTHAFRHLTWSDWQWVLHFVSSGGKALGAYDEYKRIAEVDGVYRLAGEPAMHRALALKHRLSIGTIVSDQSMEVSYFRGATLGHVEEGFIARLKIGDTFIFAGRYLELIEVKGMRAFVRKSEKRSGPVPRWMGGRLPLSTELARQVRILIDKASFGVYDDAEMAFIKPLLEVQATRSELPSLDEVLVEKLDSRDGHHLFVYTFEGRLVNEGLAHLTAYKLSQVQPSTFSIAINDWGFEILSPQPIVFPGPDGQDAAHFFANFDIANIERDIFNCLNSTEMARRQFREIARVAGLIFQGYPGANKTVKAVQISSSLLYDVFVEFDPGNLLVRQAHDEVLERHLEISRMLDALKRVSKSRIVAVDTKKASPFAMPLMVDRLRGKLSNQKLSQRILKMEMELAREMK